MEKENITRDWLTEKKFNILSFDPNYLVAFKSYYDTTDIFLKDLTNDDDKGHFTILLHDEIEVIYKAINKR